MSGYSPMETDRHDRNTDRRRRTSGFKGGGGRRIREGRKEGLDGC